MTRSSEKYCEAAEAPEPGELMLDRQRERREWNQDQRQKEGDVAVDQRESQRDGQSGTHETNGQGGGHALRNARPSRHDKILRALLDAGREEQAEHGPEHDADGIAAPSLGKEQPSEYPLDQESEDGEAEPGRKRDGDILSAGSLRASWCVSHSRLRLEHGVNGGSPSPARAEEVGSPARIRGCEDQRDGERGRGCPWPGIRRRASSPAGLQSSQRANRPPRPGAEGRSLFPRPGAWPRGLPGRGARQARGGRGRPPGTRP